MYTFRVAIYRGNTLLDVHFCRAACRPDALSKAVEYWCDVRGMSMKCIRMTCRQL